MKYYLVVGAALLASVSTADAIECASKLPAVRSGHWTYRIVEGRACWYMGRSSVPKSSLHWSDRSLSNAQAKSLSDAQAKMPVTKGVDFVDPEDGSCCWPPLGKVDALLGKVDAFESRWRALLEMKPENVAIGSQK
jgi:hypothetical protein